MKLLHYLYTPIIFPFMRKNLLTLIDFIKLERACFSDCFNQFEDIKKHIEEDESEKHNRSIAEMA